MNTNINSNINNKGLLLKYFMPCQESQMLVIHFYCYYSENFLTLETINRFFLVNKKYPIC